MGNHVNRIRISGIVFGGFRVLGFEFGVWILVLVWKWSGRDEKCGKMKRMRSLASLDN